jgi:GNAT superfamily N-acetyltransferase
MHAHMARHGDAGTFMRRARTWLLQTEAEHTLVLGLAHPDATPPDEPAYFATVEQDDAVVGCAVRTPPRNLVITRMPPSSVAALAMDVAACFDELPGVLGPPAAAREFALEWCARHGRVPRDGMEQRIYKLQRVVQPEREPAGEMRIATERDLRLVTSWVSCFAAEANVTLPDVAAQVRARVAARELMLWHDEQPRSLAGFAGRSPHGVRIGYVYTPPEWRGRGYASACVAALSQHALYSGAQFCCLYTDLSNPTSNTIYQRIGYEPVCDAVHIHFDAA